MRSAVEADLPAASRPAIGVPQALVGGTSALVLVLAVFASGGSGDPGLLPVGALSLAVVGGFLAALLLGRVAAGTAVGRTGMCLLVATALLVVWIGFSIKWSIEPDRSWAMFNRGTSYLAVLGLGILLGALVPQAPRLLAAALAIALGAASVWALAGAVVPSLGPDLELERSARLTRPVGYWNALALLLAMSVPVWLWVAARRGHPLRARAAAVGALVPALVAIAMTSSSGGILVTAVAAGGWLVLGGPRLDGVVALAFAALAALPAAWWGLVGSDLLDARVYDGRGRDGALLGVLAGAGAVTGGIAARALGRRRVTEAQRHRAARFAAAAAGVLAVGIVVAVAVFGDVDSRLDEFRNPPDVQVSQGPGRLGSFSSNHRWTWWGEAWRIGETHALAGTGAGSFELARRPLREDTQAPLAPHNVALQAFAETGVVGLALLLAVAGASVAAVMAALRRLSGEERAAAAALAVVCAAYAAHSLIDMGPEYVAVTVPFLLALGVLVSVGRGRTRPASAPLPLAAAAVAVGALALIVSLGLPWLADRRLDDAVDAVGSEKLARADERAEAAHELNPLSVEPLLLRGTVAEARGEADRAERFYVEAANLQPENPETWYELGRFTFEVRRNPARALTYLDRSYAIDNFHPAGPRLLNEVRAALEGR